MIFISPRPQLSVVILEGSRAAAETPTKGPLELPSFISLSSSPEEADAPDTPLADSPKVKGTKNLLLLNRPEAPHGVLQWTQDIPV